jgi:hypothetical protein
MSEHPPNFHMVTNSVPLDEPKVYHLPQWDVRDDREKLSVIRQIVEQYGRDPRVTTLALNILQDNGVHAREYKKMAKVFLKWVQTQLFYINEPGERLQSPLYTLKVGYGDCDDLAIVLCSFFEAVRLPWKLVISGKKGSQLIRYHEGDKHYPQALYSHIYCAVGNKPFSPTKWYYCEPTLAADLGWDVVAASEGKAEPLHKLLPELGAPSTLKTSSQMEVRRSVGDHTRDIILGAVVGSLTVVLTELLLDALRTTTWHAKYFTKRKK